jgi:hypothetical protein
MIIKITCALLSANNKMQVCKNKRNCTLYSLTKPFTHASGELHKNNLLRFVYFDVKYFLLENIFNFFFFLKKKMIYLKIIFDVWLVWKINYGEKRSATSGNLRQWFDGWSGKLW